MGPPDIAHTANQLLSDLVQLMRIGLEQVRSREREVGMSVCVWGGGGGGGWKEPKTIYTYIRMYVCMYVQYICKNDHSKKLHTHKDIQWKDLPEMTCIVRI